MKAKLMIMSLFVSATAFASLPQQGKVSMKIDSTSAQIKTQNMSVKEGDKVNLIAEVCQGPKVQLCHKEKVGTGVVSRVINENASEIKVEGNAKIKEGMLIEKQ